MVSLKIPPDEAIHRLTGRINALTGLMNGNPSPGYYDLVGWCSKTWADVDGIFADGMYSDEIRLIGLPGCSCDSPDRVRIQADVYQERLLHYIDEIRAGMRAQD